jgi:multidrug resistance efflux pump
MSGEETNKTGGKRPWWKSAVSIIIGIAVLLAGLSGVAIWYLGFRPYISTEDARIDADVVKVANLGASGQILSVKVKEGDRVTEGMVLVELDHGVAEAQYRQSKVKYEYLKTCFDRISALSGGSGFTRQQYDSARSDLESAEITMNLAGISLERTYLKSPANGIVIQKSAVTGNILEANQAAVTIADMDHAWVSANINEKVVRSVKPGQSVEIAIDEGEKISGRISDVRKAAASAFSLIPADNATGNFIKVVQRIPVKILLERIPAEHIRFGGSVEIRIKVR